MDVCALLVTPRSRRFWCAHESIRSTPHRFFPRPLPCAFPRSRISGARGNQPLLENSSFVDTDEMKGISRDKEFLAILSKAMEDIKKGKYRIVP